MTRKQLQKVRFYSNIGFDFVSAALTVNFFVSIPKAVIEKLLYMIFGVSVEGAKLYLASMSKDLWRSTFTHAMTGWKRFQMAVSALTITLVYLATASSSAYMSVGYILLTVKTQSQSVAAQQVEDGFSERNQLIKRLNEIDNEIKIQQDLLRANPPGYGTAASKYEEAIARLSAEREEKTTKLNGLPPEEEKSTGEPEVASDTIFSELGKLSKPAMSGQETLLRIMLVLAVLLEVFVFLTIGTAEDDKLVVQENPNNMKRYLASMFQGITNGKRLRSDWVISQDIGISMEECKRYRTFISGLTYKGTPLVVKNKTGMNANFSQENIERIVLFNLNIGGNK